MNYHKPAQRLLAMALSVVIVLGMMPISAAAETPPIGTSGEIIAFEALSEETANREVSLGTSLEDLNLPDTLNATVRVATAEDTGEKTDLEDSEEPVQDSGEPATPTDAEKPEQDSGEPQFEEKGISLPVEWVSAPDYNGGTAGTYTFTAEVTDDGYTVSTALPTITVTVQEEAPPTGGEITAFDALDSDIAEQAVPIGTPLSELVLPKTLAATVSGAAVSVPVTWDSAPAYNPDSEDEQPDEYTFTAQLSEGYTLAKDVSVPRITVTTSAPVSALRSTSGSTVTITEDMNVIAIKDEIIAALASYDTVTVEGSKTNISETLSINISEGKKVIWKADYAGSIATNKKPLIQLSGNGLFEVAGGEIRNANGKAIYASGSKSEVIVSGGTVTSYNNITIDSSGKVTVKGTGKIQQLSNNIVALALRADEGVSIEGGEVIADKGSAITSFKDSSMSGGKIFSRDGVGFSLPSGSAKLIISGGEITSINGVALQLANVEISGGKIFSDYRAISYLCTTGSNTANTFVITGGEICSTGSLSAVYGRSTGTLTISGGLLYGYKSSMYGSSGLIDMPEENVTVSGTGVVLAWNKAANQTSYPAHGTEHLLKLPEASTAYWSVSGNEAGIRYENGDNRGFVAIPEVEVAKESLTASNLDYTIPEDHIYNGTPQGIGEVGLKSPHNTLFNSATGGTLEVLYDNDPEVPSSVGTYDVEASISGGTEYEAVTIPLGSYTIAKAEPSITWPAASLTFGQTLSQATLSGESGAGDFAFTNGTIAPTVSQTGTEYEMRFTPTDGVNYTSVSQNVTVTVNKATAPVISPQTVSVYREEVSAGNTVNLAALLPSDCGVAAYNVTSTNDLVTGASVDASGVLSFSTKISQSATTETITVAVTMANYSNATITVTVSFVDKKVPVVLPTVSGSISYGQLLSALNITASALVDGTTEVPGSIEWEAPTSKPAVGAGVQGWTFTPDDTTHYETVSGTSTITVSKATPSGTPTITTITQQGKTLADADLTGSFTNPHDSSAVPGTLAWDSGDSTAVTANTAYTWTFTPTDGDNYSSRTGSFTPYPVGGGGGDGGSGGGSYTPTTPITPEKKPDQPVTAAVPVTATAGQNGSAIASIPEKSVTDAIAKAQADAKAQGKTANGTTVALNVTMPKGATSLTANLTRNSLNSLVSAGVTSLELNGSPVTISFDTKALAEIQKQSSGNISITIVPNASLSTGAKTMIGTRPVYDLTVSYTKDGKNATVSSFGGGTATVSVPYTPAKGEAVGGLYAVYVDAKGNATRIAGSVYDANSGCVMFTTTHFSLYGVGYTAPSAKFTDITNHWAKESIDYVVGRGLLSGTTETTFAPDTAMTRGMLVTALGRLAGVDTKAYTTNSFTDVKADSTFRPYIEWAYSKGIIQGIGSSQFAPERAITRQEIAVILQNYAKATGYKLPVTREATTYTDASSIGNTYKDAVTAMQQAGIMMGGSSNKFNPKSSVTRAEVSSMLHRYIKLTIDADTAQSWALNDAGQYLYYKDGKALTGTQTIGGAKYFFNTDGTLKTGWVKDDAGNWHFYSGNILLVGWWDIGANGNNKRYYFDTYGNMVSGKWLQIDGKWYYFYADGSLARSVKIDEYEVDENGVRKAK